MMDNFCLRDAFLDFSMSLFRKDWERNSENSEMRRSCGEALENKDDLKVSELVCSLASGLGSRAYKPLFGQYDFLMAFGSHSGRRIECFGGGVLVAVEGWDVGGGFLRRWKEVVVPWRVLRVVVDGCS